MPAIRQVKEREECHTSVLRAAPVTHRREPAWSPAASPFGGDGYMEYATFSQRRSLRPRGSDPRRVVTPARRRVVLVARDDRYAPHTPPRRPLPAHFPKDAGEV